MDDEEKRFFRVEEAEVLIPTLEEVMGRLMDLHDEAGRVRDRLQDEQRGIMLDGGRLLNVAEFREQRARLEELTALIKSGIEEILSLGAVPKDLGEGLVDFPSRLEGREINLCWRFGEKHIGYWHGLDEGYAGRRPLPEK
jgi:hypothetical protein